MNLAFSGVVRALSLLPPTAELTLRGSDSGDRRCGPKTFNTTKFSGDTNAAAPTSLLGDKLRKNKFDKFSDWVCCFQLCD